MFDNVTQEQKAAIKALQSKPEMRLLLDAIELAQKETDLALRKVDAENFQKLQGKALALQHVSSFLTT
ncbi:hypothetical protein [Aliikangiella coralliicola]|uniref:Uncharacterized protein n=1 Tax=Aliikangiella coralliicola TaxID=2592383 RepID=A0A545U061_9GAMM|nr:hypothetical protein [Aliikangiella coralliicola]TQV82855.1 hypothetical protein FLL46_24100 [Aliikangiella coralliicola]